MVPPDASLRERQVEIGRFTRQLEEAGLILSLERP